MSSGSSPSISASTVVASSTVSANTDTQSRLRQAGMTPEVLTRPGVGLSPTTLLKADGTRPEPAVSVPSANGISPRETATAEPELEPPLMYCALNALEGRP